MFVVRFEVEGDWKHALFNGPWQFELSCGKLTLISSLIHEALRRVTVPSPLAPYVMAAVWLVGAGGVRGGG